MEEDDDGVSGWGVSSVEEGRGGVAGLRCKTSPNVNTGILFLFNFPVTRRTGWGSGRGFSFSLLSTLSQSSLAPLGASPHATAGTIGDGREMGKWLGRAVLGDSGSVKGGFGEVAREITMVGRVGGGDRGVGAGRGSEEG